ncbi:hypothetical protein VaNZ11_006588 [Volvox africanus]|uniref:Uncharacterized protein n=1 Tax=Volvox africanus TaxID=51714 RepID=A0ABQ5S2B2_9CHLO|nr:hypothetical protein VaNZ11_006588 [Volvox africanus]
MGKPSKAHIGLALGVLRYLVGIKELGLCFGGDGDLAMVSYSDFDWAGDPATRRSTIGYVFLRGGGAVSWNSQLQRNGGSFVSGGGVPGHGSCSTGGALASQAGRRLGFRFKCYRDSDGFPQADEHGEQPDNVGSFQAHRHAASPSMGARL